MTSMRRCYVASTSLRTSCACWEFGPLPWPPNNLNLAPSSPRYSKPSYANVIRAKDSTEKTYCDTWRSLGCQTTPLKYRSKGKPPMYFRKTKEQTQPTKITRVQVHQFFHRIYYFFSGILAYHVLQSKIDYTPLSPM